MTFTLVGDWRNATLTGRVFLESTPSGDSVSGTIIDGILYTADGSTAGIPLDSSVDLWHISFHDIRLGVFAATIDSVAFPAFVSGSVDLIALAGSDQLTPLIAWPAQVATPGQPGLATWGNLIGRPPVIAAGTSQADARAAIDAVGIADFNAALTQVVPTYLTINGKALTGNVTLTKGDISLGNVDNTSDVNKPVSTATQTALNGKVPTTRTINGHALSADVTVTKADVSLGNVDNTSDVNKPVSTAQATAINAKYTKPGTGVPSTDMSNAVRTALSETALRRPMQRLVWPTDDAPVLSLVSGGTNSQIFTSTAVLVGTTGINGIDVLANNLVTPGGACNPQHPAGAWPNNIVYRWYCKQLDSLGTNQIFAYSLYFYSDADKVELIWKNTGAGTYRVWVDDQAVTSLIPITFSSTGGIQSLMITNTSYKTRRYRVDLTQADFVGMFVNSGGSIWPAEQRGPTVFWFGDSFSGGSGMSTSFNAQIPHHVADLSGWDTPFNFSQGGTGFLAKNAPSSFDNSSLPQVTYAAPAPGVTPTTSVPGSLMPIPDIVVLAWGHNDAAPWSGSVMSAAIATVQAARTQWPNAYIIVLGPFFSGLGGTGLNSSETALFEDVQGIANATISSLQGTGRPWLTGSGNTSSPTGSGNGDRYMGSDTVHPNDLGISYISQRLDPEIRKNLVIG